MLPSATPAPAYAVLWGNLPVQEQVVVEVWRGGGFGTVGGADADTARLRWFYLENPQGAAQVNLLAYGADKLPVGCLGVAPRRFLIDGATVTGGTLVDFVVDPKHRSAYPALTLQRSGRERALRVWEFVYGLPDTKAVAICKRLSTHVSFQLPRFVRVVRSRSYFARVLPAAIATAFGRVVDTVDDWLLRIQLYGARNSGEWLSEFDSSFDALWADFDKSSICIGVRDRAFLSWRFGAQPGRHYRVFAVRRRDDKQLCMYFVCECSERLLSVKDCLNIGSERELKQGLLLLIRAARKLHVNAVQLQLSANSPWQRALRRTRFIRRSERPFFAAFREPAPEQASRYAWYITQADEDV